MRYDVNTLTIFAFYVCMIAGGFFLLTGGSAKKQADRLGASRYWPDWHLDAYLLCVSAGMLIMQVSNILHHQQADGKVALTLLALAGAACSVFGVGVFAGRLFLRVEMRIQKRKSEEHDRAARA